MSTGPMSVKNNTAEIARLNAKLEALESRMEIKRNLTKNTTKRLAEKTSQAFSSIDRRAKFLRDFVGSKFPEFKAKWKNFLKERSAAKTLRSLTSGSGGNLKLSKF